MAFKKAQKITTADLDRAAKEYEILLKQAETTYTEWDNQKDVSFVSINKVEQLASSISHTPYTIGTKAKKLAVHKEDYKSRETIARQKRKDDIVAGTSALAVLSAGAAVAVSFWEYIVSFVSKKFGGKIGKNKLIWLIAVVVVLLASVVLLIGWAINRWKASRETIKSTKKLRKLIGNLQKKEAAAKALTSELCKQCYIVEQYLGALSQYSGINYEEIPGKDQEQLVMMLNEAILLSELMSKESK